MVPIVTALGIIFVCLLSSFPYKGNSAAVPESSWSYSGTTIGPAQWVTTYPTCGLMAQSPINIVTDQIPIAQPGFLKAWVPQTTTRTTTLVNTHHGITVSVGSVQLTGGAFMNNMVLANVHFHAPSEHTINGVQYPLETHYVFAPADAALRDAANIYYDMTVIGTLHTSDPNAVSPDLISNAAANANSLLVDDSTITLSWVPNFDFNDTFYTYQGSLTVPPCTQNINWHVSTTLVPTKDTDITALKDALATISGNSVTGNARPVQALNARVVKNRQFRASD